MKKLAIIAALAVASLSGCASLGLASLESLEKLNPFKEKEVIVVKAGNPAERAYQMGLDHARGVTCAREIPYTVLNEHKESIRMLMGTYTLEWQRAAQWEFNRGVQDGAKIPREKANCTAALEHLQEQIGCNYEEAGFNLKKDSIFK